MPIQNLRSALRALLSNGTTTTFAISVVTGIPEKDLDRILSECAQPKREYARRLETLLTNYQLAIRKVNIEMAKKRLLYGSFASE